jgi:uncharacterized protein (TIGR03790 family)
LPSNDVPRQNTNSANQLTIVSFLPHVLRSLANSLRPILAVAAGMGSIWTPSILVAGGGPENVLLLVNANSDDSKTIANHYIAWRKIPPNNVLYLDVKGDLEERGVGRYFLESILTPTLKTMDQRLIGSQIDYIVYSSDFPWRIELMSAMPGQTFPAGFDPHASITGVTYLAPVMAARSPAVVMPNINWYVPGPIAPNQWVCEKLESVSSRAFRSRYLWDPNGKRTTDAKVGQRYLLSTMLGVTRGRGNTVAEVLNYLQRAVSADGKRPNGKIYFMTNGDVRSKTRDKCYAQIASQINQLGVGASVVHGRIPNRAQDVAGLMTGTESFDWPAAGNVILAGAICEHLTSSGGMLASHGGQTPLSVFLRAGAAGASGTVFEPRAIQAKFPLPSLQLHYARGCSLAEAFYQSVSGPYQLLIVGDPLCQPWATFPSVRVEGIDASKKFSGTITLKPSGKAAAGRVVSAFDLFVDGRLVSRTTPGQTISLDTTKLADGHHELRVVGIDAHPIETQGRTIIPITVDNHSAAVELQVAPRPGVGVGGNLKVKVSQPGATAIVVRQNSRDVGRVEGEAGEIEIPAATLGRGPTTLQAFSEGASAAISAPVTIQVN